MRDRLLRAWNFSEPHTERTFGSGYPSDPKCKAWMNELADPVFGYGDFIRFSWAPTKKKLEEKGVRVTFQADLDEDDDDDDGLQPSMSAFLGNHKKRKRSSYFEKRKLQVVSAL
jgi:ribonuclease H2 subunit A